MTNKLGDNLNVLMAKARINSSELARATGLPATTIKRIRNNEQSNPTISTLIPIAKYFSLDISELIGYEKDNELKLRVVTSLSLKEIPLLTWKNCLQYDSLDFHKITKKVYTTKQVSDKSYAINIEDQELDFFPKESILIIDPKIEPELGDYVIVTKSDHNIASIRKYIIETDQIYLKSLVEGVGVTPMTSEYKILGVVVQYKVELKSYSKRV